MISCTCASVNRLKFIDEDDDDALLVAIRAFVLLWQKMRFSWWASQVNKRLGEGLEKLQWHKNWVPTAVHRPLWKSLNKRLQSSA